MTKKRGRPPSAVKVEGYNKKVKGKIVHVKAYRRKKPKKLRM